jgi:hypothetical protein
MSIFPYKVVVTADNLATTGIITWRIDNGLGATIAAQRSYQYTPGVSPLQVRQDLEAARQQLELANKSWTDLTAQPASHTHDPADLGTGTPTGSNFLRGDGVWASPQGGSDPWTIVNLAADFPTTSGTAVDITGLAFTPAANTDYMFEGMLLLRTATATVNARPGLAWATGLSDGVVQIDTAQSATTQLTTRGNIAAAVLVAVGGLPNTTQSWPASVWGCAVAGASPAGTIRLQLASETAGTTVTAKAGSFLRWRTY